MTNHGAIKQRRVDTNGITLNIAEQGNGPLVILLHGFPYDIHAYKDVSNKLISSDHRIIIPYLRGYGKTRFLKKEKSRA